MPNLSMSSAVSGGLVSSLGKWLAGLAAFAAVIKMIASVFVIVQRDQIALKMRFGNPLYDEKGRLIFVGSGLHMQFPPHHSWLKFDVNDVTLDLDPINVALEKDDLWILSNIKVTFSRVPHAILTGNRLESIHALELMNKERRDQLGNMVLRRKATETYVSGAVYAALQDVVNETESLDRRVIVEKFRQDVKHLEHEASHYLETIAFTLAPDSRVRAAQIRADALRYGTGTIAEAIESQLRHYYS